MSVPTNFSDEDDIINERTSAEYECVFRDKAENQIAGSAITVIEATLVDVLTETAINGRSAQSVLNVNGGTLAADGTFTLDLSEDDTVVVGSRKIQKRRLTLWVEYDTGTLSHEVFLYIRNLTDVAT